MKDLKHILWMLIGLTIIYFMPWIVAVLLWIIVVVGIFMLLSEGNSDD